jgi:hypothetical protein
MGPEGTERGGRDSACWLKHLPAGRGLDHYPMFVAIEDF